MLKIVVAVFDVKSEAFHPPAFVPAVGAAIRGFGDAVNSKEDSGDLQKHPEDFSLFELGTYDDNTAKFVCLEQPRLLVRGSDSQIREI